MFAKRGALNLAILLSAFLLLFSCQDDSYFLKEQMNEFAEKGGGDDGAGDGTILNPSDPSDPSDPNDPNGGGLVQESFVQKEEEFNKIDLLWVIDNSGSMADEQDDLARNFDIFIDQFLDKDIDFRMAITTTDSKYRQGSMEALTYQKALDDEAKFKSDFQNMVKVGTSGSGYEKGLKGSKDFGANYAAQFLRPDAYLVVVYMSDEEDQSPESVQAYVNYLSGLKGGIAKLQTYCIIRSENLQPGGGVTAGADRYIEACNLTNGDVHQIDDNFYETLDQMSGKLVNLLQSFPLSHTPDVSSIVVKVDGLASQDWEYDAGNNAIKFFENAKPQAGAKITVSYKKI